MTGEAGACDSLFMETTKPTKSEVLAIIDTNALPVSAGVKPCCDCGAEVPSFALVCAPCRHEWTRRWVVEHPHLAPKAL